MISGRANTTATDELEQGREQLGLELRSLIRCEDPGCAVTSNPVIVESASHRRGGNVAKRNGFRPARKSIDDCEAVTVAFTQREDDYIHVDMIESTIRRYEVSRGLLHMSRDLGLLTVNAIFRSNGNVLVKVRPDIPLTDQAVCNLRAWVRRTMKNVEDASTQRYRNVRTDSFARKFAVNF